jgi:hypothetical protein
LNEVKVPDAVPILPVGMSGEPGKDLGISRTQNLKVLE